MSYLHGDEEGIYKEANAETMQIIQRNNTTRHYCRQLRHHSDSIFS